MIKVVPLPQHEAIDDARLLRRYALEAMEFLHDVMSAADAPLCERIKCAEILATRAGVPYEED